MPLLFISSWKSGFLTGGKTGEEARNTVEKQKNLPAKIDPFKPEYLAAEKKKSRAPIHYLTVAAKKSITEKILNAGKFGVYGRLFGQSAENTIKQLFQGAIKYKTQVSDLSTYLKTTTGSDLLTTLQRKLNETQGVLSNTAETNEVLLNVVSYVNQLPE